MAAQDVQAPPLMPWENEPAVSVEDAFAEAAQELETELRGGGEDGGSRRAAPEPTGGTEDEESEETDDKGEETDDEDVEESEDDETEDEEEVEYDFEDSEWDKLYRARPHRPTVDGEVLEVDYDELLAGYSRTADYTRKSQKREEERRAEKATNAQLRERLIEQIEAVENVLDEISPERSADYWDDLRVRDPKRFQEEWPAAQLARERRQALRAAKEKEQQELLRQRQEDLQAEANRHYELLKQKLGWKDDAEAQKNLQELALFAEKQMGFSPEEIALVYDHRLLTLLAYAKEHVARQQKGEQRIKEKLKKVKPLAPGGRRPERPTAPAKSARSKARNKRAAAAMKQLQQAGSLKNAAAFFETILTETQD